MDVKRMFQKKKKFEPLQSPCPPFSLLAEHVAHAETLSRQQREFVADHLRQCSRCCDIYDVLSNIDEELDKDIREGAGIPEPEAPPTRTAEQAWAEASLRLDTDKPTKRPPRRWAQAIRVAGMIAACVAIICCIDWTTDYEADSEDDTPAAVEERVAADGHEPPTMNQSFTAEDQPQETGDAPLDHWRPDHE